MWLMVALLLANRNTKQRHIIDHINHIPHIDHINY